MQTGISPFEVRLETQPKKFIKKHSNFQDSIVTIGQYLEHNPFAGSRIRHLKGRYHCSRRWREGDYRLLYTVDNKRREIIIYRIDRRAKDIYAL